MNICFLTPARFLQGGCTTGPCHGSPRTEGQCQDLHVVGLGPMLNMPVGFPSPASTLSCWPMGLTPAPRHRSTTVRCNPRELTGSSLGIPVLSRFCRGHCPKPGPDAPPVRKGKKGVKGGCSWFLCPGPPPHSSSRPLAQVFALNSPGGQRLGARAHRHPHPAGLRETPHLTRPPQMARHPWDPRVRRQGSLHKCGIFY